MNPLLAAASLLFLVNQVSSARTWSGFRGDGTGRSASRGVPVRWSGTENVAWQVDLPGYGQSSPVVWEDRVFVTSVEGEMQDRLHVRCLEVTTGNTLWSKELKGSQGVKTSDYVSKAAPTPAVDAERVYLFFETGDLVALTHAGEPVWQRSLVKEYGPIKSNHGLGSSPVLTPSGLVLQVQHDDGKYLLSLDRKTGANQWKRDHPFGAGWATPLVTEHAGKPLLIVTSSGRVDAFALPSGEPLWYVEGLKGNTVPSPSAAGDLVVIGSSERGSNLAIRLGGEGNVTATHVVWRQPEVNCSFGSPLVHEGRVYFTNKTGVAYCLELATGKVLWETRLPASSWSSPVAAEGRVYFTATTGPSLVVKAGSTLEKMAENELPAAGRIYGTAVVDSAFLVRGGSKLIRIGKPAP